MNNPFDKAWLVLKRQTALSEYEGFEELEDMPVPNKPQKIGIPTHINRMIGDEGGKEYRLMSGNTQLGSIQNEYEFTPHKVGSLPTKKVENYGGYIEPDYRRQGLYQKLLNALIQNNYRIISDYRNDYSHPAHKKFQENLPANVAYYSPPEANKLKEEQKFDYQKKPSEMIGGIQRYDYGSLPIRNVENPEMVEYQNKPLHEKPILAHYSHPNNEYRQFMRLDEFSE